MGSLIRSHLPPPPDWGAFEDLVHDVLAKRLRHANLKRYGRQGQAQHGVDIVGQLADHRLVGIQCKNRPDGKLTAQEIDDEVRKAESFTPSLSHYIIATSAKRNAATTSHVLALSSTRQQRGAFTVEVEFWDDLLRILFDSPWIVHKHYPDVPIDPAAAQFVPPDLFFPGRRTATVFVAGGGDLAGRLQRDLKHRGVRTSQDSTGLGQHTDEQIGRAIQESDAFILMATADALRCDDLWRVQIAAALQAHEDDADYTVWPVLIGVSPQQWAAACRERGLVTLPALGGETCVQSRATDDIVRAVAREGMARALTHALKSRSVDTNDYRPAIALRTFADDPFGGMVDLDVNVADIFAVPGDDADAATGLIEALEDIKTVFNRLGCGREITLYVRARLAAALALGLAFRRTTGTLLRIAVSEGQCWSTDSPSGEAHVLDDLDNRGTGADAILILNLTKPQWDMTPSVLSFAVAQGIDYGRIAVFRLAGPAIQSGAQALSIARQVADRMKQLAITHNVRTIHLFGMMPAPLAVLLGYHLNACGPIRFYFSNPDNSYTEALSLTT